MIFCQPAFASADCLSVTINNIKADLAGLESQHGTLIDSIQAGDSGKLRSILHPRLRAVSDEQEFLMSVRGTSTKALRLLAEKKYLLQPVDTAAQQFQCGEIGFKSLYGYRQQVVALLDFRGDETVRVFVNFVFSKGWVIGALHAQSWTVGGTDHQGWLSLAKSDYLLDHPLGSLVKADLARKLLQGYRFVTWPFAEDKVSKFLANGIEEQVLADLAKKLPNEEVATVESAVSSTGLAVQIRLRLTKEISSHQTQKRCEAVFKILNKGLRSAGISGLRCGFLLPGEGYRADGYFGTSYFQVTI